MGREAAEALSGIKFNESIEKKKPWNPTDKRFVCFLDIMGFKDLVMRNSHDEIYEMLMKLSKHRTSLESENLPSKYADSLKTVSFSDSIVIFTKDNSIASFDLLTFAVSWLFAKAMEDGIPMKGAIAFGDMSINISRQIFFGQPLIDAYLLEEDVAFYGIVVHNTAEKFINDNQNSTFKNRYIDTLIPLKSGKINHLVLDWVISLADEKEVNIRETALNLMKKQREKTSGSPRKYIDNTIEIIEKTHSKK
ncbi:MAG: hypothetical protein V4666_07905 [Bacteroidota bacterium]